MTGRLALSIVLGGGNYGPFDLSGPRIGAIVPISPQGPDQFGGFDNGPDDNTWVDITLPVLLWIGEDEINGNVTGTIQVLGWRLVPFDRMQAPGDKFESALPDQDHGEMGSQGSSETQAMIAGNMRLFFDVMLREHADRAYSIGYAPGFGGAWLEAKSDPAMGLAIASPPSIGLPEPPSAVGVCAGALFLAALTRRTRRVPR